MKKLIWPCKRLFNSNALARVSLLFIVNSCQPHPDGLNGGELALSGTQPLSPPYAPREHTDSQEFLLLTSPSGEQIATVAKPNCANKDAAIALSLNLLTQYGEFPLKFDIKRDALKLEVQGTRLALANGRLDIATLQKDLCENKSPVTVDPAFSENLKKLVKEITSDCESIEPINNGFQCKLPLSNLASAKSALLDIQANMIRRWGRQPYLLTRRVAIAKNLADTLASAQVAHKLQVFCKIIENSLPTELPLVMTSKKWQTSTCQASDIDQAALSANFGLAKAVAELKFMSHLFEQTSALGTLSLHRIDFKAPPEDLLISLIPTPDVISSLVDTTDKVWSQDTSLCWHPLFSEDASMFRLAKQMSLSMKSSAVTCEQPHGPSDGTDPYFTDSITTETEFVVTNGKSKTLRLPRGTYTYAIRPLPENPEMWDDAAQSIPKAEGTISWEPKKSRPFITTW